MTVAPRAAGGGALRVEAIAQAVADAVQPADDGLGIQGPLECSLVGIRAAGAHAEAGCGIGDDRHIITSAAARRQLDDAPDHIVHALLPFPAGFSAVSLASALAAISFSRRELTSCRRCSSSSSGAYPTVRAVSALKLCGGLNLSAGLASASQPCPVIHWAGRVQRLAGVGVETILFQVVRSFRFCRFILYNGFWRGNYQKTITKKSRGLVPRILHSIHFCVDAAKPSICCSDGYRQGRGNLDAGFTLHPQVKDRPLIVRKIAAVTVVFALGLC